MIRVVCSFLAVLIFFTNLAWGQTGNNIEERITSNEPIVITNNEPLYIDENLVLLKKPKFFTAFFVPSTQYTDNVFLNGDNEQHDWVSSLTGGVDFKISTQNNFKLNASLAASKFYYQDNSPLDYDSLQGNIAVSYAHKKWLYSLQYAPAMVFEKDFNERILTLHRFTGLASKSYQPWNNFILSPFSAAHYVTANPDEFSYVQIDTGVRATYLITSKIAASLTPQTYYKTYDDYFENQTGIKRADTGARINAQISYKIKDNMNFTASAGYTRNNSTLTNNSYDLKNFSPTLQFTYKF
mgnify:CR=1 FL=1